MISAIRIDSATTLDEVKALLVACGLPTEDIRDEGAFVVARAGTQLCGTAGMELLGAVALLRSVAVHPRWRRKGIARALCDEAIRRAGTMGARRAFLLTTDAQAFFRQLGFAPIERASLPAEIRGTAQFRELCPASATAMARDL